MSRLFKLEPIDASAHQLFEGMDGITIIPKNIEVWQREVTTPRAGDAVDYAIAVSAMQAKEQGEDGWEVHTHISYVISQLQIFQKNLLKIIENEAKS